MPANPTPKLTVINWSKKNLFYDITFMKTAVKKQINK